MGTVLRYCYSNSPSIVHSSVLKTQDFLWFTVIEKELIQIMKIFLEPEVRSRTLLTSGSPEPISSDED